MSSSSSSKKKKQKQKQSAAHASRASAPRLSVPSLSTKAAAAAPATTSALAGSDALLATDRRASGSFEGSRFPTSTSASTIGSGIHSSSSLSYLMAQGREARTRTSSSASSQRTATLLNSPTAPQLLSTSAGAAPSSSPAPTFLSVSPPSPRKHSQDVSDASFASFTSDATEPPASTVATPSLIPALSSSGGAGGALKSLQRVASRDRLQKEQADQAAAKKASKKKSKKKHHEDEDDGLESKQPLASDSQSVRSTAGSLAAAAPAHNESVSHQESAHAEADRLIEADRVEAEQLEAHVLEHQGDLKPKTPTSSEGQDVQQLSAAFKPSYQPRKTKSRSQRSSVKPLPVKHTQSGSASSNDDHPPEAVSAAAQPAEPDPRSARRTRQGWHAQLEADRGRIGNAIGDMVISGSSDDSANGKRPSGAGWRQWRRTDRSAEVGSVCQAGLGPRMGLVWHGPGLGLPAKIRAGVDMGRSTIKRILGGDNDTTLAERAQDNTPPGPMQLVGMRYPLPLLVPHSAVEWATAALGAGVCMQAVRWAFGGEA
ncbi:hypothetical protein OC835_006793 [Tilletia horrida]|nr:hypothetical protein OC835_006793 [Tilletia horrida]